LISERKHRLAPQIKELRALRTKYTELDSEHVEKKMMYDNTKAGLESNFAKLQEEANAAEKAAQHEESNYHYYESMCKIAQVKMQRVQDERTGKFRRTMPDGTTVNSYKELFAAKIKQQEGLSKELLQRQKRIKEHHAPNARQVLMFKDLHKLLRSKVEAQTRARAEANDMMAENAQDTNIFTMPEGDDTPVGGVDTFDVS